MAGKTVCPPRFNFMTRQSEERDPSEAITLPENGVLVVEGLHGLNKRVSGNIPDGSCIKIFIMPYGNVYCDTKLMDSNEIRLLRRIVRDYRHRDAHALSTIDYWPMIEKSEEAYYSDYLTSATYHQFVPCLREPRYSASGTSRPQGSSGTGQEQDHQA